MPSDSRRRLHRSYQRTIWKNMTLSLFLTASNCASFEMTRLVRPASRVRNRHSCHVFRMSSVSTRTDSEASDHHDQHETKLIINNQPIRTVMAPMVAASDYAFRRLVRHYNADLCFTQMLHARNVVNDAIFRRNHMDFGKLEGEELPELLSPQRNCIIGAQEYGLPPPRQVSEGECGPLIVQLAGHDPSTMVQAAQLLLKESSPNTIQGFDVNLGCPQGIARKGRYGAFLMEQDVDLVTEILLNLRESLPSNVKVSAKIRLPVSLQHQELRERLDKLIHNAEIDFLTIHGRTLEENKTKVSACHVDMIRQAIEMAPQDFPVIANGGMQTFDDVAHVVRDTGASAAMSSEALLETPNLFAPEDLSSPRALLDQQIRLAREYVTLAAQYPPTPGALGHVGGSFNIVRGHLFKMLHRYVQEHIDLREQLASREFTNLGHAMGLLEILEGRYSILSNEQLLQCVSSKSSSSWYRRHWNASKNVHTKTRGGAIGLSGDSVKVLSVNDRKAMMQERIARLRQERHRRERSMPPESDRVAA